MQSKIRNINSINSCPDINNEINVSKDRKLVNLQKAKNPRKPEGFYEQLALVSNTLPMLLPEIPKHVRDMHIKYIAHLYKNKGKKYTLLYLKSTQKVLDHILLFKDESSKSDPRSGLSFKGISIGLYYDGFPK
jgi:hypothetical protein